MLASEQLIATTATLVAETPVAETLVAETPAEDSSDAWQPVAATAHVAQGKPVDSFLSVLPEDANGTVRGARRATWRR